MASIESVLARKRVFEPRRTSLERPAISRHADLPRRSATRRRAITRASGPSWRARSCSWHKPFTQRPRRPNAPFYKWFEDGTLNASYNCLDRNVENGIGDKTAIIFEADDGAVTTVTYPELLERTCKLANALKSRGLIKGDRVVIYMPMSIEGVVAMQACARIGATHSVVFGGFSAQSAARAHRRRRRSRWSSPPTSRCAAARRCR